MKASGREQLEAMAGRNKSRNGMRLSTPMGYGVVTEVFADMRRYFAGTWFDDAETQQSLRERAIQWSAVLSRFKPDIVRDVMADLVSTGNVTAPSLHTFAEMCELKLKQSVAANREDVIAAKEKAMAQIRAMRTGA